VNTRTTTVGREATSSSGAVQCASAVRDDPLAVQQLADPLTDPLQQSAEEGQTEEKPGPVEAAVEVPVVVGTSTTTTDGGERSLSGANARWEGTPTIQARADKRGEEWFVSLTRFDMDFEYWLNSDTVWNHIRDFPGGSYDHSFNTREGSRTHEIAEINGTAALWNTFEATVRAGITGGFATRAEAEANYNTVLRAAAAVFNTASGAISDHSNPVGPDAEWEYLRQAHAAYEGGVVWDDDQRVCRDRTPQDDAQVCTSETDAFAW